MNADEAAPVLAPYEGAISVTSVTAGAASAAIALPTGPGAYFSIAVDDGAGADSGAYLTAKANAAPADPNPTATSGTGRTMWFDAPSIRQLVFRAGDQFKVYVPGSGTYYVRQYRSSP